MSHRPFELEAQYLRRELVLYCSVGGGGAKAGHTRGLRPKGGRGVVGVVGAKG